MTSHWKQAASMMCIAFLATAFSLGNYQGLSRADKAAYLDKKIAADSGGGSWPSTFGLLKLFQESMAPSFDHVSDEFPSGRTKLIHSVGPIAKAEFVAVKASPYTGLFQGADTGYARLSFAKQSSKDTIVPGASFKWLRDGMESGNIFALFNLVGQKNDMNFFTHNFTNHPEMPDPDTATKMLKKKFQEASAFPRYLGLSTFASHDQEGEKVTKVAFPFEVVFEANSDLRAASANTGTDEDLKKFLIGVPVGATLLNVHCREGPDTELALCGFVKTVGKFDSSKFGDEGLFFQHTRMEDDFALHPEWPQVPQ